MSDSETLGNSSVDEISPLHLLDPCVNLGPVRVQYEYRRVPNNAKGGCQCR